MKTIKYKDGYKYQLQEDYCIKIPIYPKNDIITEYIELTTTGILRIKKGYAWDGATVAIDTNTILRASLVHDALYQLLRQGLISQCHRQTADAIFYKICLADGMAKIRAWYVYNSVRHFAEFAADPKNKKQIKIAP